ncbi:MULTISPECIES: LysR family transcriptional regulator ArgP [unclassified Luteococcus]|uniref:LysR family transcriptional regulator ArgP n=1 Tax=unclassified Luteococcus TaxID=2639923 RepID=UPI00313E4FC0
MNGDWLRTMIAVVDEGSFEAAADDLRISPSAVSQRIKALEARLGQVVVRRTLPCAPTTAGEVLLRMARQVVFLEDETLAELGRGQGGAVLRMAVNADSLATWFRPVLREAAGWEGLTLRLEVEDQGHSSELLRRGDVIAAVTSDPVPVAGCRTERLGAMRYLPVASPELVARHGGLDGLRWAELPALRYNAKDDLQLDFLRRKGIHDVPPQPQVPGSEAFLAGVLAGLAWGMIPKAQLASHLEDGSLVRLPGEPADVGLHWQVWRVDSPRIERATAAVRRAARGLAQGGT